jgi:Raf kinase inhibitor-like YbhB/YbcL family protein
MTDPDAGDFIHWVVSSLDPAVGQVPQNGVPEDAVQTLNSFGTPGYKGPCPPSGTHTYFVTLYALREPSTFADGSDPKAAIEELDRLQLASTTLTGTFTAQ